jgi:hypothetical protein
VERLLKWFAPRGITLSIARAFDAPAQTDERRHLGSRRVTWFRSHILAALLSTLWVALPALAHAQAPMVLRGLQIGVSTVDDVRTTFPQISNEKDRITARPLDVIALCPNRGQPEAEWHACYDKLAEPYRIAGGKTAVATYVVYPLQGIVEKIVATFDRVSFDAVKAAVTTAYGPPTQTRVDKWQDIDRILQSEVLIWERPDGYISLDQISTDRNTAMLVFESQKYRQLRVPKKPVRG